MLTLALQNMYFLFSMWPWCGPSGYLISTQNSPFTIYYIYMKTGRLKAKNKREEGLSLEYLGALGIWNRWKWSCLIFFWQPRNCLLKMYVLRFSPITCCTCLLRLGLDFPKAMTRYYSGSISVSGKKKKKLILREKNWLRGPESDLL